MKQLDMLSHLFSNISITIRLHLMCKHEKGWNESKTKVYHTLWCMQSGSLCIEVNHKVFEVKEGDVVLFYPGDTYRAYSSEDCAFLVYFFALETGNGLDFFKNLNWAGVYSSEKLAKKCKQHCEQYLDRLSVGTSIGLQLYSSFFAFLTEVLELQKECCYFYDTMAAAQDSVIQSVVDYMKEHYTTDLSVDELAKIADMSEKYFIRQFHFHMAVTPKQYLVELRMKRALKLLSGSKKSIAEIAGELGYSDQYCFSKAFRKYYGEAPSTFRKNIL